MKNIEDTIHQSGGRYTKIKKCIISALSEKYCLLSGQDILLFLERKQIKPNRSTMFRELQFLIENSIINKVIIFNNFYYELNAHHHHHLICLKCSDITPIQLKSHLEPQELEIENEKKFKVTKHSLEFYGYCQKCK